MRSAQVTRNTLETQISVKLNLDGSGVIALGPGAFPDLSPDGQRVVYRGADEGTYVRDLTSGVAHLLPDAAESTLKNGILRVLEDDELRRRMSREGPRRAAAYDWRVVTKQYLDLMIPLAKETKRA